MAHKYFKIFLAFFLLLFVSFNKATAEEILTWQDCIKEAAKNHPDLIAAEEVVKQSEANKKITASTLFPQINSSLSTSTAKTSTSSSSTNTYAYGATGAQLLFDGIKTINNVKAASENINAAQQNYRFTSSEVRLNLRSAFINLLKAQELIQVAQEIVKIRRDNLVLITLRYSSGLEHKGALLTAQANLAEANFELSQAKRSVMFSQRQLTKELGRREFTPMFVKGDFAVQETAKEEPSLETLAKNHPSLLQLLAKENAAAFGIKSAYANFSPQLSGNAGVDKTGNSWPPRNNQWNLGLSMTMPIFEGGLRFAQVSLAQAIYNQAKETERSAKDKIIVNLEQTWVTLQDALETVEVQKESLAAAEERSKIAEAQYSIGFIAFDNWIIIENDLVKSKRDFLNAQASALAAEANWIQAKGETIEYAQ